MDETDRVQIHATLVDKCSTRGIIPSATSLADPEIKRRAEADWKSLTLELSNLPEFEERYERVSDFYSKLPWQKQPATAIIPQSEYDRLDATAYLRASPANVRALDAAIARLDAGEGIEVDPASL